MPGDDQDRQTALLLRAGAARRACERPAGGFHIDESVNGVVSLVKDRPQVITEGELAAVEAAVKRHPKRGDYQVRVKDHTLVIFERQGPDIAAMKRIFGHLGPLPQSAVEHLGQTGHYIPILRFVLLDSGRAHFRR